MRIKDVIKQTDRNGNVRAFVIYIDGSGKESYIELRSEQEYNYYVNQFKAQVERERKYNRPINTPGANYHAKQNPFINYEKHKNVKVAPKVIAILIAAAIGTSAYALTRNDGNYMVAGKIQDPGIFHSTKESRFIDSNEQKFAKCANALMTGDFSEAPSFDAEFIREYIHSCYMANVDDLLTGGKLNGNRYDFDFEQFMSSKEAYLFDTRINNSKYENFISSNMGDSTYKEANSNGRIDRSVDRYIDDPLSFMLQHLDSKDDEFAKLSPFARIVMCEEVKSMLLLEEETYSFFSHETPNRNASRDELIEQINQKEESAMFYLDRQITEKRPNIEMEGRSR